MYRGRSCRGFEPGSPACQSAALTTRSNPRPRGRWTKPCQMTPTWPHQFHTPLLMTSHRLLVMRTLDSITVSFSRSLYTEHISHSALRLSLSHFALKLSLSLRSEALQSMSLTPLWGSPEHVSHSALRLSRERHSLRSEDLRGAAHHCANNLVPGMDHVDYLKKKWNNTDDNSMCLTLFKVSSMKKSFTDNTHCQKSMTLLIKFVLKVSGLRNTNRRVLMTLEVYYTINHHPANVHRDAELITAKSS
jgi:hypothetical protein